MTTSTEATLAALIADAAAGLLQPQQAYTIRDGNVVWLDDFTVIDGRQVTGVLLRGDTLRVDVVAGGPYTVPFGASGDDLRDFVFAQAVNALLHGEQFYGPDRQLAEPVAAAPLEDAPAPGSILPPVEALPAEAVIREPAQSIASLLPELPTPEAGVPDAPAEQTPITEEPLDWDLPTEVIPVVPEPTPLTLEEPAAGPVEDEVAPTSEPAPQTIAFDPEKESLDEWLARLPERGQHEPSVSNNLRLGSPSPLLGD